MDPYSAEEYAPWPMRTGSPFRPSIATNDMVGSHTRSLSTQPLSLQHPVNAPAQPSSTSSQLFFTFLEQPATVVEDRGGFPGPPRLQQVHQPQQNLPSEPKTSQDHNYDTFHTTSPVLDIAESTACHPVSHYRFQYSLSHTGSNTEAPHLEFCEYIESSLINEEILYMASEYQYHHVKHINF